MTRQVEEKILKIHFQKLFLMMLILKYATIYDATVEIFKNTTDDKNLQ